MHDLIGSHWIYLQVIISMVSSGFLDRESSEAYIEFLVKQCAIPVVEGRPIPNHHGAVENSRARELPDADSNKVLITIHRIKSCREILRETFETWKLRVIKVIVQQWQRDIAEVCHFPSSYTTPLNVTLLEAGERSRYQGWLVHDMGNWNTPSKFRFYRDPYFSDKINIT